MKGKALKDIKIEDLQPGLKIVRPPSLSGFAAKEIYGEIVFVRNLNDKSYIIIECSKYPYTIKHSYAGQWFVDKNNGLNEQE